MSSLPNSTAGQYGVGQAGLFNVLLHFRLAAEIGKIRGAIGIGDADVHETPNAGALGGVEQDLRVGERLRKGKMRRLVELTRNFSHQVLAYLESPQPHPVQPASGQSSDVARWRKQSSTGNAADLGAF